MLQRTRTIETSRWERLVLAVASLHESALKDVYPCFYKKLGERSVSGIVSSYGACKEFYEYEYCAYLMHCCIYDIYFVFRNYCGKIKQMCQ
jgi:hypothetical protein